MTKSGKSKKMLTSLMPDRDKISQPINITIPRSPIRPLKTEASC